MDSPDYILKIILILCLNYGLVHETRTKQTKEQATKNYKRS